jgi:hypothetical protein
LALRARTNRRFRRNIRRFFVAPSMLGGRMKNPHIEQQSLSDARVFKSAKAA